MRDQPYQQTNLRRSFYDFRIVKQYIPPVREVSDDRARARTESAEATTAAEATVNNQMGRSDLWPELNRFFAGVGKKAAAGISTKPRPLNPAARYHYLKSWWIVY